MFMIPDTAWKFGCGRYIQKYGALQELKKEVCRLGSRPLLLSGATAWKVAGDAVKAGLGDLTYYHVIHKQPCCEETAKIYASLAKEERCNVIVGIGGGVLMDTAKLTAELAGLPVLTIPTLSATCAAFAPLSVVYTPEGKTRGSWFYENEVSCCIADMEILSQQPLRYVAAGVLDSLAKAIEIRHNLSYEVLSSDMAFAANSAEYIFTRLTEIVPEIAFALSEGKPTKILEEMVYLTIPATGIVSGAARGRMQSALGHCLYESIRTAFTKDASDALHGELVGIGLRMQLKYDFGDSTLIDSVIEALQGALRLSQVKIPFSEENLEIGLRTIMNSSYTEARDYDVSRLCDALKAVW